MTYLPPDLPKAHAVLDMTPATCIFNKLDCVVCDRIRHLMRPAADESEFATAVQLTALYWVAEHGLERNNWRR